MSDTTAFIKKKKFSSIFTTFVSGNISIKLCISILRLFSENLFTVFSSFEANESPECYLRDGKRKYWDVAENKAKNATHHFCKNVTDCRANKNNFAM